MSSEKYTLITGASSGIGKAMSYKFAEEGHNLIIIARRKEKLDLLREELISEHHVKVVVIPCDLSVHEAVLGLYEELRTYYIRTFVNNAGSGDYTPAEEADIAKVTTMINLNIQALTTLSLLYIKDYKDKEDATLMNVSSIVGYFIASMAAIYSATKFYVTSFSEGLSHRLIKQGYPLRVKILCPGPVRTHFEQQAAVGTEVPVRRGMNSNSAEEIAVFALELYRSDQLVGIVEGKEFKLKEGKIYIH